MSHRPQRVKRLYVALSLFMSEIKLRFAEVQTSSNEYINDQSLVSKY